MNRTSKILIYILLFVVIVLVWNKGCHIIDINPIIFECDLKDYNKIKLESYEIQFVIYSGVCFVALALFSVIKKIYIAEIKLFYMICTFPLCIYIIISCLFFEIKFALTNTIVVVIMLLINKELKESYPKYSFVEILLKRNILLVMFIVLILVAINITYIIVPKNKMFVYYEHSHRGEAFTYDLIEDGIEEKVFLDMGSWINKFDGQGSVIEAKTQGEKVVVYARLQDEPPKYLEVAEIEIDENLKFHFDIDLEYIMLFYPLNFFIIVWCMLYLLMLLHHGLKNKLKRDSC